MSQDFKVTPLLYKLPAQHLGSDFSPHPVIGMVLGPELLTAFYGVGAVVTAIASATIVKRQVAAKKLRDMQRFFGEQPLRLRDAVKNPLNNAVDLVAQARTNRKILSERKNSKSEFKELAKLKKDVEAFEEFDASKKLFSGIPEKVTQDFPTCITNKEFRRMEAIYTIKNNAPKTEKAFWAANEIALQKKIGDDYLKMKNTSGDNFRQPISEMLGEIYHMPEAKVTSEQYRAMAEIYSTKIGKRTPKGNIPCLSDKENELKKLIKDKFASFAAEAESDAFKKTRSLIDTKMVTPIDANFLAEADAALHAEIKQLEKKASEGYFGRVLKAPFRLGVKTFSSKRGVVSKVAQFFSNKEKLVVPLIIAAAGFSAYKFIQEKTQA